MADIENLKRLAEVAKNLMWKELVDASRRPGEISNAFMKAANPAAILELIAENKELCESHDRLLSANLKLHQERDRLRDELTRIKAEQGAKHA
ncbi:hypothetical protein ACFSKY_00005 [Azotobacter chroococcum]|uniref:Uncharacterized protein n=1 Tax=Azotobacter chroococcum TaxID=353 RepID=A0A4R1PH57_9GAMM|nr:hypothetical protein [Azotobacter chroococcum]TBV95943.1 hypothetical protein E0E53_12085 [Azotobacter chroococcum]TCL26841.1 hypothetical protein EV691_12947 [Azotobacter chroococcum]